MLSLLATFRFIRIAAPAALLLALALAWAPAASAQSRGPADAAPQSTVSETVGIPVASTTAAAGNVYDASDALPPALSRDLYIAAALLGIAGIAFLRPRFLFSPVARAASAVHRRRAFARLAGRRITTAREIALAKEEAAARGRGRREDISRPRELKPGQSFAAR